MSQVHWHPLRHESACLQCTSFLYLLVSAQLLLCKNAGQSFDVERPCMLVLSVAILLCSFVQHGKMPVYDDVGYTITPGSPPSLIYSPTHQYAHTHTALPISRGHGPTYSTHYKLDPGAPKAPDSRLHRLLGSLLLFRLFLILFALCNSAAFHASLGAVTPTSASSYTGQPCALKRESGVSPSEYHY